MSEDEEYALPPLTLLDVNTSQSHNKRYLAETAIKLQKVLYSFGISAKIEDVLVGPTIITYGIKLADGISINRLERIKVDLAINLGVDKININRISGKSLVGIEVEKKEKDIVKLGNIIKSEEFQKNTSKVIVGLGKDIYGNNKIINIEETSHILVSGTTGSGKSVFLHALINSILYKAKSDEIKFMMIDTKMVELALYNEIPHMLIPVITDSRKALRALAWVSQEMENRYTLFNVKGVKNLNEYNENNIKLPNIVIIIDEFADLIETNKKEIEEYIYNLTRSAGQVGIYLIIATERPSINVISGLIKANINTRVAFMLPSQLDSKTILDVKGAEELLGNGDMLFKEIGGSQPTRYQGAFISNEEIGKVIDFIKEQMVKVYNGDILEMIEKDNKTEIELEDDDYDNTDPLLMEAIDAVVETRQASTSFIQRRFKIGYARSGRIIDQMEERGIISGYQGSKPREVLMSRDRWNEIKNVEK